MILHQFKEGDSNKNYIAAEVRRKVLQDGDNDDALFLEFTTAESELKSFEVEEKLHLIQDIKGVSFFSFFSFSEPEKHGHVVFAD